MLSPTTTPTLFIILFVIAVGLIVIGVTGLIITIICETICWERQHTLALAMRDDAIAAPQCVRKSRELGFGNLNEWKDYFTKDNSSTIRKVKH